MTGTQIVLHLTFHSGFRVGAATPLHGVDQAVDWLDPLPGDHLKGLLRDQADLLVELRMAPADLPAPVFGTTDVPSPWSFSSADGQWSRRIRHRVSIDEATGTAKKDHLLTGEQAWAPSARARIVQVGRLSDGYSLDAHTALLRTAARMVKSVGQNRRRGLGSVGVTTGPATPQDDLAMLRALTGGQP